MIFNATCTCSFEDVAMGLGMIGTDPEILHGRWLMGWLLNYTGARGGGWLIDNGGRLQHYCLCCRKVKGGG